MATKKTASEVEEVPVTENGHKPFLEASRKVLLAAIGAVALAQDEIEDFVNKLVERGEIAEKDGKKLVREVMDRRRKEVKDVEDETSKRIHEILDRMNVPSKKDIDLLGEKIATLTKKVEELKKG